MEVEANGDGDVDQANDATSQNDKVVLGIGPEGIDEAGFGIAITRVEIFAQQWEDSPGEGLATAEIT